MSVRHPSCSAAMRRRVVAALAVGAGGVACATVPLGHGREYGRKQVAAKVDPDQLVATDRSQCRVSRKTYDNVVEGASFSCLWRGAGDDVPSPANPPSPRAPGRSAR